MVWVRSTGYEVAGAVGPAVQVFAILRDPGQSMAWPSLIVLSLSLPSGSTSIAQIFSGC